MYGAAGATFFEIKNALWEDLSPQAHIGINGWVTHSAATVNFCGGYNQSTVVRFKALPGDGFNMCDVYDSETGALLTASTAAATKDFYTVPTHGKVCIISHNFLTAGEYYRKTPPSLDNSKYFTPITQDGGSLVVAKLFVTPIPDFKNGKYIELLCGINKEIGTDNIYQAHSGKAALIGGPINNGSQAYRFKAEHSVRGPKSSEFSQGYVDDSASLHTYSDYMLHTEVVSPDHIRIKYNTMKPFKYATFSVKTHNGAEIQKVIMSDDPSRPEIVTGWRAAWHFHENKTDVYGRPLEGAQYSSDGYSVVTISAGDSYTDAGGTVHNAVAYPESFSGMGNLCDIFFDKPLFKEFPIKEKTYICPPIGESKQVDVPQRTIWTPDSKETGLSTPKLAEISKEQQSSQSQDKTANRSAGVLDDVVTFNSQQLNNPTVIATIVGSDNMVESWRVARTGSVGAAKHNNDNNNRPKWNAGVNDSIKSVSFEGGMGLSTNASGTDGAMPNADINKWSIYGIMDLSETLNSYATMSNGDEAIIFNAGGNGTTQISLTLSLTRISSTVMKLKAVSKGNDAGNQQRTTTLEYPITLSGSGSSIVSAPNFHEWNIISWIGDSQNSTLYVNGKQAATGATTHSVASGPMRWFLGHDGSQNSISSTVGATSGGRSLKGRIANISLFKESHSEDFRKRVETRLAFAFSTQGTTAVSRKFPSEHPAFEDDNKTHAFSPASDNEKDKTVTILVKAAAKVHDGLDGKLDFGSDRCGAQWVSDHVCLDKSAQTLLNISCEGTGDDFFLGD